MPSNFIEYDFWLTFCQTGAVPRVTKNEPRTTRTERSARCQVKIPKNIFSTPSIEISMEVPETGVADMTAQVTAAVEDFKKTIGMDIDFTIRPATPTEEQD